MSSSLSLYLFVCLLFTWSLYGDHASLNFSHALYILRKVTLTIHGLTDSIRLAGSESPGIFLFLSPQCLGYEHFT